MNRYHRHADGAVHLEEDAEALTICQRSHVPVVVIDPADIPWPLGALRDTVRALRTRSVPLTTSDDLVSLLDYLADQIEQQTSPPVAEPVGLGAVVRDGEGIVYVRQTLRGANECWVSEDEGWYEWIHLPQPVTVLAEGWTEGA